MTRQAMLLMIAAGILLGVAGYAAVSWTSTTHDDCEQVVKALDDCRLARSGKGDWESCTNRADNLLSSSSFVTHRLRTPAIRSWATQLREAHMFGEAALRTELDDARTARDLWLAGARLCR